MKQSGNIGFITCYFGELPWYFDYFINSCKYNPSVDFYIITNDHTYKNTVPKNVRLIYKTLDDVNAVATEKLGFEINITC